MPTRRKVFRVFVSSTFADLKEERQALASKVWPRLQNFCRARGAEFHAIDLRWGVSEEAGRDHRTMEICFGEIDRCRNVTPRPNFLILLGERYGWRPLPARIPATEFVSIASAVGDDFVSLKYTKDKNAIPHEFVLSARPATFSDAEWRRVEDDWHGRFDRALSHPSVTVADRRIYVASATEQEIARGAFMSSDASEHVLSFQRTISGLPHDERSGDFIDRLPDGSFDAEAADRLADLKHEIRDAIGEANVAPVSAKWGPSLYRHLDALCEEVAERLEAILSRSLAAQDSDANLVSEAAEHASFGSRLSTDFRGRVDLLRTLVERAGRPGSTTLLHGKSGCGKSSVMARVDQMLRDRHRTAVVVTRFLGATTRSTDGRSLLEDICTEITAGYGVDRPSGTDADFGSLEREFRNLWSRADASRPLVLILDGLDQLAPSDLASDLWWLPWQGASHVHLFASVADGRPFDSLAEHPAGDNIVRLDGLDAPEAAPLFKTWLAAVGRTVTAVQWAAVDASFQAERLPLHLRIASLIARRWRSDDAVPLVPSDLKAMIRVFLGGLASETNHGDLLVRRSLGYIASARYGLTEEEIVNVLSLDLSRDEHALKEFRRRMRWSPEVATMPYVIWSRLAFDLEGFLTERLSGGTGVLAFYHRQLLEVVELDYLPPEVRADRHQRLAECFERMWRDAIGAGRDIPLRVLEELPFHQARTRTLGTSCLLDLTFLAAKVAAGMAADIPEECDEHAAMGIVGAAEVGQAVGQSLAALTSRPASALQTIVNCLSIRVPVNPAIEVALARARTELDARVWLRRVSRSSESTTATREVPLAEPAWLGAVCRNGQRVAAVSDEDRVFVVDVADRGQSRSRGSLRESATRLATDEHARVLAYRRKDGRVGIVGSTATVAGRSGEQGLAVHSRLGAVAVDLAGRLVAVDPRNIEQTRVLADSIPAPADFIFIAPDTSQALVIVRGTTPRVLVIDFDQSAIVFEGPVEGPGIVCAAMDWETRTLITAARDRSISTRSLSDFSAVRSLRFEAVKGMLLRGEPLGIATGLIGARRVVAVTTSSGHVGLLDLGSWELRRLDDFGNHEGPAVLAEVGLDAGREEVVVLTREGIRAISASSSNVPKARRAPVAACAFGTGNEIIGFIPHEHAVVWQASAGGRTADVRYVPEVAAVGSALPDGRVVVGMKNGGLGWLSRDESTDERWPGRALAESVTHVGVTNRGVTVVGRTGSFLTVAPGDSKPRHAAPGSPFRRVVDVACSAGSPAAWALVEDMIPDGIRSKVVDLLNDERVVLEIGSPGVFSSLSISPDGQRICVAGTGEAMKVLRRDGSSWRPLFDQPRAVKRTAFMRSSDYLAIVAADTTWIEILDVSAGGRRFAEVFVPAEPSCIAVREDWFVVGCTDGSLHTFELRLARSVSRR